MRLLTLLTAVMLAAPTASFAGFEVSSFKKESRSTGQTRFGAASALDGDPATAWMIDPESKSVGSWIEVEVPAGKVDKVHFVVGWAESDDLWADYARVKTARIEVTDLDSDKLVSEKEVSFDDKQQVQMIDLDDVKVGGEFSGGKVRLTVIEVYPGKDYEHLAMSEMLVYMNEFDVARVTMEEAPASAEGHDGEAMLDGSSKTYWASEGPGAGASFTVDPGNYSVSSLRLVTGPRGFSKPKTIEVEQGGVTKTYEVNEKGSEQWFMLPAIVGYTGSGFGSVTVRVIDTWPGDKPSVAITDVKFKATALAAF